MRKSIVAILGSPRKGQSYRIVKQFAEALARNQEIDFQYVFLKDLRIEPCRGCGLCLEKGEDLCPLKDQREDLFQQMAQADGIIMATPVYSLQVSALLKNMLDRFAYIFHRPCFFGKVFMPVVTQGVYGAEGVVKYLNELAGFWGFRRCPGLSLTLSLKNPPPRETAHVAAEVEKAAVRFAAMLKDTRPVSPSYKEVLMFHMVRSIHARQAGLIKDHEYYRDQGWFASDYYCPARLSWLKRLLGRWADRQGSKMADKVLRDKDQI